MVRDRPDREPDDLRSEGGQTRAVHRELQAGDRVGAFLLERRIAVGGMGEVWCATGDTGSGLGQGQRFALKVVRAELLGGPGGYQAMFIDEVRIAERLRHPNIARLEGVYADGEWVFTAMELIDGADLRRLLGPLQKRAERFPPAIALLVGRDVARALGFAHAARSADGPSLEIVHRDVSPQNIMLTREGGVKLLDFGIARARERLTRTAAGTIKGKPAYMAPEQAMGLEVSPRTDVFALGVVLWELFAMKRLFDAAHELAVLSLVLEMRPPRLAAADVPTEVADLVEAMLAKRPEDRPASMRGVEDSLSRALALHYREDEASPGTLGAWVRTQLAAQRAGTTPSPVIFDHVALADPAPEADVAPTEADVSSTRIVFDGIELAPAAAQTPARPGDPTLDDAMVAPTVRDHGAPREPAAPALIVSDASAEERSMPGPALPPNAELSFNAPLEPAPAAASRPARPELRRPTLGLVALLAATAALLAFALVSLAVR
jgi:serine/threonine protein kinase